MTSWWPVAITACLASACAMSTPSPRVPSLSGSTWWLHAIHNKDDGQGTILIDNPQRYTMHLSEDGRANFRLDCNRGTGDWQSTPSADGASGRLTFGPIATTRALCPPPHWDGRIARDLAQMQDYRFKDGRLFMSLPAGGGVYEWHPQ